MSFDVQELAAGVSTGQRRALARAITLVESTRADHRRAAVRLLEGFAAHAGRSIRIGISGVPGVGKSTFIEALGQRIIADGHRIAVLSVDPSSALSGGSILGDKTRMETLARSEAAFIRPSPAGASLGGVARRTREVILVCEAAGYDVVIVETVGVGQSETMVAQMTDLFLLLLLPGAGDDLQGIKRGIMELADLVLINKADGELLPQARRTMADYRNALHLLRPRSRHWKVPVECCSALAGEGIEQAWQLIGRFRALMEETGELLSRRAQQAQAWMWQETADSLLARLRGHPQVKQLLPELEEAVRGGRLPPTIAAGRLLEAFLAEAPPAGHSKPAF